MATISGMDKLISNLTALKTVWDDPAVVNAGAAEFVEAQKANVRKKLNQNSKGALENAIQVIPINNKVAEAGIPANTLPYQLVHEFGKIIVPKKKKALKFEIDGEIIIVKQVEIPARPYVRPSVRQGQNKAVKAIINITNQKMREKINV